MSRKPGTITVNEKTMTHKMWYLQEPISKNKNFTEGILICDSGICRHYCKSSKGLFNVENIKESITVRYIKSMAASIIGSLICRVIQLDGSGLEITLHEVKLVPELWVNVFSINKVLKNGYNLSNNNLSIFLSKGSVSVTFERVLSTTNDSVSWVKLLVSEPLLSITPQVVLFMEKVDINEFHKMLGHCISDRSE
jgi:hypothetical protein